MKFKTMTDCWSKLHTGNTAAEIERLIEKLPEWSGDWYTEIKDGTVYIQHSYFNPTTQEWEFEEEATGVDAPAKADLVIDPDDLFDINYATGDIKVDTYAYNGFIPDAFIKVQITDSSTVGLYRMIDETEDYIEMEFIREATFSD